jgi:hypothetical protein
VPNASIIGPMKTMAAIFTLVAAFAGCKQDNGAAAACKESCDRTERQLAAVRRDVESADRMATAIESLKSPDDAEARLSGESALRLCDEIGATIAHASGIAWAIADEARETGRKHGIAQPLFDENAFSDVEKVTATCHGDPVHKAPQLSPAQLKADLVVKVHALRAKPASNATCAASCDTVK